MATSGDFVTAVDTPEDQRTLTSPDREDLDNV